jgi:hypothetical protein
VFGFRVVSQVTGLPQKRFYRQRAHSNPLADHVFHEWALQGGARGEGSARFFFPLV